MKIFSGENLRLAIQESGLQVQEVSSQSEISREMLHRYLRNDGEPNGTRLQSLAAVLGKPMEYFFVDGVSNGTQGGPDAA